MWAVAKKEFQGMFTSIKAIVVILVFCVGSFFVANSLSQMMGQLESSEYYSSLRLLVFVMGYLFATILSHNCINSEVEMKTIRLLVTKVSKTDFVLGKFLGLVLFWMICLIISFLSVSALGRVFDISQFIMVLATMIYFNGIVVLLSAIIDRSAMTNFIGLLMGLAIPGLGLWITIDVENRFGILKFIFPYYYILKGTLYMGIPLVLTMVFVGVAVWVIRRKDF